MRAKRAGAAPLALLLFAGVWAVWRVLVGTYHGQRLEAAALKGSLIGAHFVTDEARRLLSVISMPALVGLILLILAIGLWRVGRRRALWAAASVIATNASTQIVKKWVLDRPNFGFSQRYDGANTLPSGHTAVAASAAVALILLVPARWRPLAAWVGSLGAAAIGYSTLVCQWHRPADVIAALLMAAGWGLVAIFFGAWNDDVPDVRAAGALTATKALGGLGVLIGVIGAGLEAVSWVAVAGTVTRADCFLAYAAGSAGTLGTAMAVMALLSALAPTRVTDVAGDEPVMRSNGADGAIETGPAAG